MYPIPLFSSHRFISLIVILLLGAIGVAAQSPSLHVEGYAGRESYAPGDELTLHVSTTAETFAVTISRWGEREEPVWSHTEVSGADHPVPEHASSQGCDWPVAVKVKIPADWRTGYYDVRLRVEDRGGKFIERNRRTAESRCFFVVRPANPGKDTKILLQLATNTYSAYNSWGGSSLYAFNARGNIQGNRVSFQRPPRSLFDRWELKFVQWAERNGYALDYATNLDLERRPELLSHYRLVLSVGHDEYWSAGMRDHLEAFIGDGGNVAFFSGNSVCWQVRPEDDGQALVCWKENYHKDPVFPTGDHALLTSLWGHHLVNRPENQLTGVGFLWGGFHRSHGQFMEGSGAYKVHRPEHWVFADTGLKRNDEFGGKNTIVGYECDGCELEWRDGLPYPTFRDGTPETFTVLSTAPARWHPADSEWYERWEVGRTGNACMGLYTRGGTVFTAATTDWSHGLVGNDPVVEKITRNVLDRLSR